MMEELHPLTVSPYLQKPLRSYGEVAGGKRQAPPKAISRIELEQVIRRALTEARDQGQGPLQQIDCALAAAHGQAPAMGALDLLGTVNRVRRQIA